MINRENKQFELVNIVENAIVVYKNGDREIFDAVCITDKGVTTGHIIDHVEFEEGGFIPKANIKKIIRSSKDKRYKKKLNGLLLILQIYNIVFLGTGINIFLSEYMKKIKNKVNRR